MKRGVVMVSPLKKNGKDIIDVEYVFELPVPLPKGIDIALFAEEKISWFLDVLSLYFVGGDYKEDVLSIKNFDVICTNLHEIESVNGIYPMFSRVEIGDSLHCTKDTFDKVLKNYYTYENFDTKWHLVVDYIRTGMSRNDVFLKFTDFWISFNTLYNLKSDDRYEPKRIENTILEIFDTEQRAKSWIDRFSIPLTDIKKLSVNFLLILSQHRGNNPVDILIKLDLKNKSGKKNYSRVLKDSIEKKEYRKALVNVVLCLYALRCKLLHGTVKRREDKDIFILSSYMLESLLQPIIHYELNKQGLS
jgi:hypothetical protein